MNSLGLEKRVHFIKGLTIMNKIGKNARSSEKLLELATLVHIEKWIIMMCRMNGAELSFSEHVQNCDADRQRMCRVFSQVILSLL